MTAFSVREMANHELDSWDDFVEQNPMGTLYHTSKWKQVIETAYQGARFPLIGTYAGNDLVGGLCGLARNRVGVSTLVTPLCTPYTGFLLPEGGGRRLSANISLMERTLEEMQDVLRTFRYQNLQCSPGLNDPRVLAKAGYIIRTRHTLELNLKLAEDELWNGFDSNVRQNIRKAKNSTLEVTDQFDEEECYRILQDTFRRRNEECPVPNDLFRQICEGAVLKDNRKRYVAKINGSVAGFLIVLFDEKTVYYELAGATPEALKLGTSSLLIWEMLREHCHQTWHTFDFAGANTRSISRFKEGFNPRLKSHFALERCSSRRLGIGRFLLRLGSGKGRSR